MEQYMYSKAALGAAQKAWNKLSNLIDSKPMLFKHQMEFKTFYDELCRKILSDKEQD
jgi:hypothetical protein